MQDKAKDLLQDRWLVLQLELQLELFFPIFTVGAVLGYAQVIHIIRMTPSSNGQVPLIES